MTNVARIANWLWLSVPAVVGRRSRWLGIVLSDGAYLTAWPIVALVAPLAALALGFAIGAYRYFGDETFTTSIVWPLLLVIPGGFGAALGLAAAIGFAIGDFLFFPHLFLAPNLPSHLWQERVPLLISYEVLLGLTVLLPLAATGLPMSLVRLYQNRTNPAIVAISRVGLSAGVAAFVATGWSASAQILIRPLESFRGGFPSSALVQPLRQQGVFLIAAAAALIGIRVAVVWWLERRGRLGSVEEAQRRLVAAPASGSLDPRRQLVGAFVASATLTLLLAGLLSEPWQALILFGAVFVSTVLRSIVLPRLPAYSGPVQRIPPLLRVLALALIGYGVGTVVLPLLTDNPPFLPESWSPMVIAASISIILGGLLLPSAPLNDRPQVAW